MFQPLFIKTKTRMRGNRKNESWFGIENSLSNPIGLIKFGKSIGLIIFILTKKPRGNPYNVRKRF
ncbi:MAG: hypothetical protein Kow0088_15140 [Anaerolineales bacterium]